MSRFLKYIYWISLVCIVVATAGCTRNNGDIGDLFGTWRMTDMTVDGSPATGLQGAYFWSFQNDIINFKRIDDPVAHRTESRWGKFTDSDGYLYLNLRNHSGQSSFDWNYVIFPELKLPLEERVPLKFVERTSKEMKLSLTLDDGQQIVYVLEKQ